MGRLTKPRLFEVIENAIRNSEDWNFLHLTGPSEHPARYLIYKGDIKFRVRIYIWNLTHGGGPSRPEHEYRIQITGIESAAGPQQFQPEIGGKTLILGWWNEASVFAGFDFNRHAGPLGSSPSMQISDEVLNTAYRDGFAVYRNQFGELAVGFRPDFFTTYVENLEALHQSGASESETNVLTKIGANPSNVTETEIETTVPKERQYAFISAKRALRENDFRDRVLTAYGHQCAICGVQLKLLDAAHILPVAHPDSTDETRNGVALCPLHHRAYDRALIAFDKEYRTLFNEPMIEDLQQSGHDGGLEQFRSSVRPLLILPPDRRERPAAQFVLTANQMRGWSS